MIGMMLYDLSMIFSYVTSSGFLTINTLHLEFNAPSIPFGESSMIRVFFGSIPESMIHLK
jgi:hypothetical protein